MASRHHGEEVRAHEQDHKVGLGAPWGVGQLLCSAVSSILYLETVGHWLLPRGDADEWVTCGLQQHKEHAGECWPASTRLPGEPLQPTAPHRQKPLPGGQESPLLSESAPLHLPKLKTICQSTANLPQQEVELVVPRQVWLCGFKGPPTGQWAKAALKWLGVLGSSPVLPPSTAHSLYHVASLRPRPPCSVTCFQSRAGVPQHLTLWL